MAFYVCYIIFYIIEIIHACVYTYLVIGVCFFSSFLTDATNGAVPLDKRKRQNTSGSQGKRSRVRQNYSTTDTNEGEHCLSVLKQLRIFVCALQIY